MVKTILTIFFVILSIALTVIVLMQEGKGQGLSASLSGSTQDSYWSKNKGRSKDAVIAKVTIVLVVIFFIVSILLSSKFI